MEAEVLGDLYCQEVLTQSPEDAADSHGRLSPDYGYNTYNTYSSLHDARNADYLAARPDIQKAHVDPTLLEERVFRNMMDTEDCYIADNNYFENVQSEIKPHMRKIVIDWMLEVGTVQTVKVNSCCHKTFILHLIVVVFWTLNKNVTSKKLKYVKKYYSIVSVYCVLSEMTINLICFCGPQVVLWLTAKNEEY